MNWDSEFVKILLDAKNYRDFLRCFFLKRQKYKNPKRLSYQHFANLAGFSSRGFMNDVIAGRKQFSPDSFDRISVALKLNHIWKEYFYCLVAIDNFYFRSEISLTEWEAKLLSLQNYIKENEVLCRSLGEEVGNQSQLEFPENLKNSLYVSQSLSVTKEKWPLLKKELLRIIIDFADQSDDPKGDLVAKICISSNLEL